MKLKALLFLLIVVLVSCSQQYPIISGNDYKTLSARKKILKNYLIIPKQKVFLNSSKDEQLVYKFLNYLKNKDNKSADITIKKIKSSDLKKFAQNVFLFSDTKFAKCYFNISEIKLENFEYLRLIILANCMIEMNKSETYKRFTKAEVISTFQNAYDLTDSKIIKNEIKFQLKKFRYNRG